MSTLWNHYRVVGYLLSFSSETTLEIWNLYLQVVTKIVKSLTNSHTFTCIKSFVKLDYVSLIFTRNQYRLSRRKLFIKFAKFNQISHKQPFNSIQVTAFGSKTRKVLRGFVSLAHGCLIHLKNKQLYLRSVSI